MLIIGINLEYGKNHKESLDKLNKPLFKSKKIYKKILMLRPVDYNLFTIKLIKEKNGLG